ncbi:hypothetical protein H1P_1840001 [Hyella patelloides LEGE 07179]|uniref:Uncharacterized protein n=1 Tax=Hyella patelloides LEGE 07179 TaxID=945734 RepID=A0A563VNV4_9CYAN|nr:hypothetical protein H1P_1840001 [Hyella patelloides LEGE 07179]
MIYILYMNIYSGIVKNNFVLRLAISSKDLLYLLSAINKAFARIAQVVEQRTENPRVGSSSLPPGISIVRGRPKNHFSSLPCKT